MLEFDPTRNSFNTYGDDVDDDNDMTPLADKDDAMNPVVAPSAPLFPSVPKLS